MFLKISQTCHPGLLQPRGCGPSQRASDRYYFDSTNTRNFSARLLGRTHSADPRAVERAAARSVLRRRLGRRERELRVTLPPLPATSSSRRPTHRLLAGSRRARSRPSLRTSRAGGSDRERERGCDGAGSASGDLSESEDGIPVGSALVCVRVRNWSHRRHLVVARLEGSHVAPVRLGGVRGLNRHLKACPYYSSTYCWTWGRMDVAALGYQDSRPPPPPWV